MFGLTLRSKQSLTVLVPLSGAGADFEGGGTAFWSEDARNAAREGAAPTRVLTPTAGTALIFGGELTHAACEVVSGTRHIWVASFTPRPGGGGGVAKGDFANFDPNFDEDQWLEAQRALTQAMSTMYVASAECEPP